MPQFIQRLFPLAGSDLEFNFTALELDLELQGRRYNYARQHGIGVGPKWLQSHTYWTLPVGNLIFSYCLKCGIANKICCGRN